LSTSDTLGTSYLVRSSSIALTFPQRRLIDRTRKASLTFADCFVPIGVIARTRTTLLPVEVGILKRTVLALTADYVEDLPHWTTQTFMLLQVKVVGEETPDTGIYVDSLGEETHT